MINPTPNIVASDLAIGIPRTSIPAYASLSDVYQFIWIKKGAGSLTIDFEDFPIKENMFYCVCPGQLHELKPGCEVAGFKILFSKEIYLNNGYAAVKSPSASFAGFPPMMQVKADYRQELESVLRAMVWESGNELHLRKNILEGMFKICLAFLSREISSAMIREKNDSKHSIFKRFLELVDIHYASMKQVWEYAEALTVSSNYLSEVVKRVSGRPASHFIYERLVLEAKRMAATSHLTMKEIAFQMGFEDPAQFSKFFKMRAGINFTEFRKEVCNMH